jgi:hypothetical protein
MSAVTYDSQSFMIEGRRVWIVSGTIPYFRVPRESWEARIFAAKHAGLNTVETPVAWSRHEARPGQFDFTGDNDLRHFVELIGKHGMYCVLRMGPYVGAGLDLGGIPSWVVQPPAVQPRTANSGYLEACSRFITAIVGQIRDLQVTAPGKAGPILLVQSEAGWTCGHDELAHAYLGELNRYLREAGLTVPIINANDLWQGVEGEIDTWTGAEGLLANLRQLGAVRPHHPRHVSRLRLGRDDIWGQPSPGQISPGTALRRLAETLAAGAQFNIDPFHGGTNFGFSAGRSSAMPDAFSTTSADAGGPINELGQRTPLYSAIRRLCTFASRFGRVLANLEPSRQAIVRRPAEVAGDGAAAVVHAAGSQGSVVFLFTGDHAAPTRDAKGAAPSVGLLLPDGTSLDVYLGGQSVKWCLFDARLTGRTTLDYCNLCALALVGRVFVCYGPAGTRAVLSINGSRLEVDVPADEHPQCIDHEGILVAVCSDAMVDSVFVNDEAVYFGVSGLSVTGQPIPHPDYKVGTRVASTGEVSPIRFSAPAPKRPGNGKGNERTLTLNAWTSAPATSYADGSSPRYASIAGPGTLDALGAPYGYGWYRLSLKRSSAGKQTVIAPGSGHRLHLLADGASQGVLGVGPGAEMCLNVGLKKGEHQLVVLAENFGRFSDGTGLKRPVGLAAHLWGADPVKLGKPKAVDAPSVDLLTFRAPLWEVHRGDATDGRRLQWSLSHRKKTPVALAIEAPGCRGVVLLNNEPLEFFEACGLEPMLIDAERLGRAATLEVTTIGPLEPHAERLAAAVRVFDAGENLTEDAQWAFAKWEPPTPDAFSKPSGKAVGSRGVPTWWRCTFVGDGHGSATVLELAGITKGQILINGRHLGRYFVATADGESVPPQTMYPVPRSWLHHGAGLNELMIFDEHGASPVKCRMLLEG